MNDTNFWSSNNSSNVINELNSLKNTLKEVDTLRKEINDNLELANMLKNDDDQELHKSLEASIDKIDKELSSLSLLLLLNGPYDSCDCILEIHPGAG